MTAGCSRAMTKCAIPRPALARPLAIEDYVIQSSPDCSPAKWHLAHTTWFFENFLLTPALPGYRPFHPQYGYLFNSYYETVGTFFPRPLRGMLSRPTVDDVYRYRAHVDQHMRTLIERSGPRARCQIRSSASRSDSITSSSIRSCC